MFPNKFRLIGEYEEHLLKNKNPAPLMRYVALSWLIFGLALGYVLGVGITVGAQLAHLVVVNMN